jgi:hypothetical protein
MTKQAIERRFAKLEARLGKLQAEIEAVKNPSTNWERAIEKYAGDEGLQAVFSAAMKLREADRKRARQRRRKSDTKK